MSATKGGSDLASTSLLKIIQKVGGLEGGLVIKVTKGKGGSLKLSLIGIVIVMTMIIIINRHNHVYQQPPNI